MRGSILIIGIVLVMVGLVWVAQGLNLPFAPRSFMTSDRTWIFIGVLCTGAGALLAWWSSRHRSPAA